MSAGETKRIAFTVQYDGSGYHGWQLQRSDPSVQGELERVLSRLFASPARVRGAGRTDRGVHAIGQVASVDAPVRWTAPELCRAMNALLPPEIRIAAASEVSPHFHPRYEALERSYIYRIGVGPAAHSPFHSRWCWALDTELDLPPMITASGHLLGDHSFRAFAKAGQEERGDRCTVTAAKWVELDGVGLEFHIAANRFLHHMVRYVVGTLVEIGRRRRPASDLPALLAGSSLQTSPPAPARGLFLRAVRYPEGAYPAAGGAGAESLPPTIT